MDKVSFRGRDMVRNTCCSRINTICWSRNMTCQNHHDQKCWNFWNQKRQMGPLQFWRLHNHMHTVAIVIPQDRKYIWSVPFGTCDKLVNNDNNYEFWVKLISREKAVTEAMLLCRSDICRRRAVISRSDHPVIYSGSLIECNVRL